MSDHITFFKMNVFWILALFSFMILPITSDAQLNLLTQKVGQLRSRPLPNVISYIPKLQKSEKPEKPEKPEKSDSVKIEKRSVCKQDWLSLYRENSAIVSKDDNSSISFAIKSHYDFLRTRDQPRKRSYFRVPVGQCPRDFTLGILNTLNSQRERECLSPLTLSENIRKKAQYWVSNHRNGDGYYDKSNDLIYGALNWGDNWWQLKTPRMHYGYWDPFETTNESNKGSDGTKAFGSKARPWVFTANQWREYYIDEWSKTSKVGVGCSTYYTQSRYWAYFFIAIYFDRPNTEH